jgi:probable addiction module antidote protein
VGELEVVDPATLDMEKLRARTKPFDAAKYLETDEDIAEYLTDAFATGRVDYIAHALGVAARSRRMQQIADQAGLNEKSLYRALSEEGNPRLDTLVKVLAALGITLKAEVRTDSA